MRAMIVALLFVVGCKDAQEKAKDVAKKADNAVDKATNALDIDEIKKRLTNAKEQLAKNLDALDDCGWAKNQNEASMSDDAKAGLASLRRLCALDFPLARATRAVVRVEKAKQEQPEAPSHNECNDDDWPKVKAQLDETQGSEKRWTELKARWTAVCK